MWQVIMNCAEAVVLVAIFSGLVAKRRTLARLASPDR